jgi:hypothetical protein
MSPHQILFVSSLNIILSNWWQSVKTTFCIIFFDPNIPWLNCYYALSLSLVRQPEVFQPAGGWKDQKTHAGRRTAPPNLVNWSSSGELLRSVRPPWLRRTPTTGLRLDLYGWLDKEDRLKAANLALFASRWAGYCFATMRTFPRNWTHGGVDHAWLIFNLHTENSIFLFYTTT